MKRPAFFLCLFLLGGNIFSQDTNVPPFDFDRDISNASLEELRYLRNEVYARKGYLFRDAVLRAWFQRFDWYQPEVGKPQSAFKLDAREEAFVQRVKERERQLVARNFVEERGVLRANMRNIVNTRQFTSLSDTLLEKLAENGFAVIPGGYEQLFDIYEENDYNLFPCFITTDLYLQLMHMVYDFTLRKLEEKKFIESLRRLLTAVHGRAASLAARDPDEKVRKHAEWVQAWCAVPLLLLDPGKPVPIPAAYANAVKEETRKIHAAAERGSTFLRARLFDYTLFAPRGHYTRSDALRRYFRAVMWLQTAPFRLDDADETARAIILAYCSRGTSARGVNIDTLFAALTDPLDYLLGEADNLSLRDVRQLIEEGTVPRAPSSLIDPTIAEGFRRALLARNPERIRARAGFEENIAELRRPRLFFLPQRYTPDAEVLQRLVNVERPVPKRPFPKGLDVFAALGNSTARSILLGEYKETESWDAYDDSLEAVTRELSSFRWENNVYGKWLRSLSLLFAVPKGCQPFMRTDAWQRKSLTTALASWTEMKHDVILYAKQPFAAECGGGDELPPPVTVGYVEPNIPFWEAALDMLRDLSRYLEKQNLKKTDLAAKTRNLIEMGEFFLRVSRKELAGERLTDKEYETIRLVGASASRITLSIIEANDWASVEGPDRSVALAADVYTYDVHCLQEAVGLVNTIYTVVEIDGLLYLTRGAVFSYYEFIQPAADRLTDERWQEMLRRGEHPPVPAWVKPNIAPVKEPEVEPGGSYGSGC
ncbi:MAG: DUF3160 domain-containing protein [Bacteroidota bacterium]|nr:DUF3160 domain-containing protein [Bacteroidota bacterium]